MRRYALRKILRNLDLAPELGAKTFVFRGGRKRGLGVGGGAWEDYDVDAVGERGPGSSGSINWQSSISPGRADLGAR